MAKDLLLDAEALQALTTALTASGGAAVVIDMERMVAVPGQGWTLRTVAGAVNPVLLAQGPPPPGLGPEAWVGLVTIAASAPGMPTASRVKKATAALAKKTRRRTKAPTTGRRSRKKATRK